MRAQRASASRVARRQVTSRGPRQEDLAIAALGCVLVFAGATWFAGQLSAVITDRGWPSWSGSWLRTTEVLVSVYAQPGNPMARWPGLTQGVPSAVVFWLIFGALVILVGAVAAFPVVAIVRLRPVAGFASRREVKRRLGGAALCGQVERLRPVLARTSPRPDPLRLGVSLGRDVHTGVACYSSVRQSMYVLGPSESGKTSAVVIPTALDHDGPLLAPSSRTDVMAASWQARRDRGRVLVFDPLQQAPALPMVRWDPVRACVDPTVAMRRAQALMSSVDMSRVTGGDVWKARGQTVLRNLLHAAAVAGKDIRAVIRWAYDQSSVEPAAILQRSPVTPDSWADAQFTVISTPERQRAGYYMPVESALDAFTHPAVLHTCTPGPRDQFDPQEFVTSAGDTVFLLAQRAQAVETVDLLAALMEDVLHHARAAAHHAVNNRLDPPLRLLIDEAPNTATLVQLPDLISDGGGRGIPTTMVVQDRAQAADRWGRDAAASMWGAATVRVVLPGVAGHDDLRELAAYVDEHDEHVPSVTRHPNSGESEQYSLRTRTGMTTAQVRALPPFHALVIAAGGLPPVLTELTPYHRRPDAAGTARAEQAFYQALADGRTLT